MGIALNGSFSRLLPILYGSLIVPSPLKVEG